MRPHLRPAEISRVLNRIAQYGFAVVRDASSPDQLERLLSALDESETSTVARPQGQPAYASRDLLRRVPEAKRFAESAAVRSLVEPVLGPNPFAVRGLFFDKTVDANWKVAWHQDLTIAVQRRVDVSGFGPWSVKAGVPHVQPPALLLERMLSLRLHLNDCDASNGALRVLPGSHRHGKLTANDIQKWRAGVPAFVCAVKRGGVLLMRPLLLHASSSATHPSHRRVIHLEFAAESLSGGLQWLE